MPAIRSLTRPNTVIAMLALFLALCGSAGAAKLITGKQIKNATGNGDVCELRPAGDRTLDSTEFDGDEHVAVLQGEVQIVSGPTRVRLSCSADDQITVDRARIRALQVGELTG